MYWNQTPTPAAYNFNNPNAATVTYLPIQPAQYGPPSTVSPNTNPYYFSQPQQPAVTSTARPTVHIVEKGESVYSISKRYVCAEECIRRANNMPLEGNVVLQINQQIIIPECSCQVNTVQPGATGYQTNPNYLTNPGTGNVLNNTSTFTPQTYSNSTYTNPDPTYINPTEPFSETSVLGNQQAKGVTTTQPAAYFQEYVVKQGDTMGSIAARFKVSSAELVQVNSLEVNETLMPGKRLLIPRTN